MRVSTRPVGVPARTVRMAVTTEVVRMAMTTKIVTTTEVVTAAVAIPWGFTIADTGFRYTNDGEVPQRFSCLFSTLRTGDELDNLGHRHALFSARPTARTEIFVKSHARIVGGPGQVGQANPPPTVTAPAGSALGSLRDAAAWASASVSSSVWAWSLAWA